MDKIKVRNMESSRGNLLPNQFIIKCNGDTYFQSYNTIIAKIEADGGIVLDKENWNYSRTTAKYRNLFLGENTAETRRKIEAGVYSLIDLD